MRMTCPTCDGKGKLDDLDLVETDLDYPNGKLRNTFQYPIGGFPPLSCDTCKGQGWIDSTGAGGGLLFLHQIANNFWVLSDGVDIPEAVFTDDLSGFVVISTVTENLGSLSPYARAGFITLN